MTVNDLFSNSPPKVSHSLSFLFVGVCVGYDVTGRPGRGQSLIGYDHHCCCMITNHRLHTFTFPWIKDYHLLWWRGWSKEKFFSIYEWKRIFSHWKLEISISVTFRPMLMWYAAEKFFLANTGHLTLVSYNSMFTYFTTYLSKWPHSPSYEEMCGPMFPKMVKIFLGHQWPKILRFHHSGPSKTH